MGCLCHCISCKRNKGDVDWCCVLVVANLHTTMQQHRKPLLMCTISHINQILITIAVKSAPSRTGAWKAASSLCSVAAARLEEQLRMKRSGGGASDG